MGRIGEATSNRRQQIAPAPWSGLLRGPAAFGFRLHALRALVVVGEFLHVRERDLSGQDRIVAGDVRLWIVRPMLELDVHAEAELLQVEAGPVGSDLVADTPGLFACSPPDLCHDLSLLTAAGLFL